MFIFRGIIYIYIYIYYYYSFVSFSYSLVHNRLMKKHFLRHNRLSWRHNRLSRKIDSTNIQQLFFMPPVYMPQSLMPQIVINKMCFSMFFQKHVVKHGNMVLFQRSFQNTYSNTTNNFPQHIFSKNTLSNNKKICFKIRSKKNVLTHEQLFVFV